MIDFRTWLTARSEREQRLLSVAGVLALTIGVTTATLATRDHFRALHAQLEARRTELAAVRRLVAQLEPNDAVAAPDLPLVSRLETAATTTVGRERLAAMTPATNDDGRTQVGMRIIDASLTEVIAFLHAVESPTAPARVTRLELRTRPNAPARFDLLLDVASLEATP